MLCRTIFVLSIGLVLVKLMNMEPMKIEFGITSKKTGTNTVFSCDHSLDTIIIQKKKYTVLEGEELQIKFSFKSFINYLRCAQINDPNKKFDFNKTRTKNVFKVAVLKSMGGVWNCTVLKNMNVPEIQPVVTYEENTYTAAYCFMQLHVRQKNAPQTILMNNMVLEPVRTDLSVPDIDFTAEYKYADGDKVDVNCFTIKIPNVEAELSMTLDYIDSLINKLNTKQPSSESGLGFRARLNPEYDNTDMICTYKGLNDLTKVSVKFIMQAKFDNIISMRINGMLVRPKMKYLTYYEIEYKYITNEQLELACETDRDDVKLKVVDHLVEQSKFSSYDKPDVTDDKKVVAVFKSADNQEITLRCTAETKAASSVAEAIEIKFTPINMNDPCKFHVDLPVNNTVMELYEHNKLKIIVYEFEDGDDLTMNCFGACSNGPITYVHFEDSDTWNKSTISKDLHFTRQQKTTVQICYLKEQMGLNINPTQDSLKREIRVIFREKVPPIITTSTTVEPALPSPPTTQPTNQVPPPVVGNGLGESWILPLVGGVTCIVIICVSTVIFKLRKRNLSQGGPHDRNYENLPTPSEASIPAHPVQWESNTYAVPMDQRRDDTEIYSVPECSLYTTAVPKHARKKTNNTNPTYAVLNMGPSNEGPRNNFKDLDEPNYAEIRNIEECYAKVVPKSNRKKEDSDPYSYVTNEGPYANIGRACPEPMYCEPAATPRSQYANVMNNSPYANSPGNEYAEPTYCEARSK